MYGDRFDWAYEVDSIWEGMANDLQEPVGPTVPWYVYSSADTQVDPIYDVGSYTAGRFWKPPLYLPVLSAIRSEGQRQTDERGEYIVDSLRLIVAVDAARRAGLTDVVMRPDQHTVDRVVYQSLVFSSVQVRVRGLVKADYAVVGIDMTQVKMEELVNDPQFQQYIPLDFT